MAKPSLWSRVLSNIRLGDQWLKQTPDRSLEQAYDAALKIRKIEEEHFQGESITAHSPGHPPNTLAYFKNELKRHLTTTKVRLAEFRLSYSIVSVVSPESMKGYALNSTGDDSSNDTVEYIEQSEIMLEKLRFIDQVIARYAPQNASKSLVTVNKSEPTSPDSPLSRSQVRQAIEKAESLTDTTGILPRSILGTLSQIQKNLDPEAVGEVVEDFRSKRSLNLIALRFLVLLVVITISSGAVAKTFVIGPIVEQLRAGEQVQVFINEDLEERAFHDLQRYEEKLKFQTLIGQIKPLSNDQIQEKLKQEAVRITERYRHQGSNAIKNIFSDVVSVIVFSIFILISRQDIAALKIVMDRLVYGLSDSAKAFILILITDIFVGFHSPHGWEVIIEGTMSHFGIPTSHNFIFLFIATFPVILDTVFKYWIFRYLNRVSPSAVSVLKTMNEV
jgi:hypothetical protein